MNDSLLLLLIAIISLLAGVYLGRLFARLKHKSEAGTLEERLAQLTQREVASQERYEQLLQEREILRKEKEALNMELTRRNSDFENLDLRNKEQKAEVEKLQEKFTKEFENLANKILDEKSTKFTKQNKESLDGLLKPLKEKIESFENKVVNTNKESFGRHEELKEQIRNLSELNAKISKEADNLTKALKGDSKMQGNWGEVILTRILEKSGLQKDEVYTLQDTHKSEDGKRLQSDVIIHLPDGKKMIIDSKVSLVDFERFVSEVEDEQKNLFLKKHINSIKTHINTLSGKNYHYLVDESPDTVFMFIPIEPAFAIASAHEPNLYEYAFNKEVIIVTPSTLLAALRLVDNLWQNDRQKQNTKEIVRQATNLYDKFRGLINDLNEVGKSINKSKEVYSDAMNKLHSGKGNLISRVENLKTLGISPKIDMPLENLKRAEVNQNEDDEDPKLLENE